MRQVGPSESIVCFDILNNKGRFINHRIFGDTCFKIDPVPRLDKFSKTDRGLNNKGLRFGFLEHQD